MWLWPFALVVWSSVAHANGRPASVQSIAFEQGHSDHVVAGTTFGLVRSDDGGATWRWMCEKAVGYGGTYDPDYAFSSSGAIFATTFDGTAVNRDSCTFGPTVLGAHDAARHLRRAVVCTSRAIRDPRGPDRMRGRRRQHRRSLRRCASSRRRAPWLAASRRRWRRLL